MSKTGGCGTRHQRLLAALLGDPTVAAARDPAELGWRDSEVARIITWWEL